MFTTSLRRSLLSLRVTHIHRLRLSRPQIIRGTAPLGANGKSFHVKASNNVSSTWDPILATTSSDWSQSTFLNTRRGGAPARGVAGRPTGRVRGLQCEIRQHRLAWDRQIWITAAPTSRRVP